MLQIAKIVKTQEVLIKLNTLGNTSGSNLTTVTNTEIYGLVELNNIKIVYASNSHCNFTDYKFTTCKFTTCSITTYNNIT